MKHILLTILLIILSSLTVYAYDLPEIIGVIEPDRHCSTDFCCVGDANLDGKDDLLIRNRDSSRVELYYGAEHIEDEFDMAFTYNGGLQGGIILFGTTIVNLGGILPEREEFFSISAMIW